MNSGTTKILHSYESASAPSVMVMDSPGAASSQVTEMMGQNGNYIVRGVRIFRSGTFKDSMGIECTWTNEDLVKMQENFRLLRSLQLLRDVPIRADHSRSVKDVVGWFGDVYVDPSDPRFLLGDIEFTEPSAYDKWKRGTFRSRSAEIGLYESNGGQVFYPSVLGLAFVDIGAVEGLYSAETPKRYFYRHAIVDKENVMTLEQWLASGRTAEDWVKAVEYAASLSQEGTGNQNNTGDQTQTNETDPGQGGTPAPTPPPAPAPTPTPPSQIQGQPALANHGAALQTAVFQVNGAPTQDVGAVQAHITLLEKFRSDTISGVRAAYVKNLVETNKIAKTQAESTGQFVQSLTEEQFLAYQNSMDAAPTNSLLGSWGNQPDAPEQPQGTGFQFGAPVHNEATDIEVALEIVDQHRRAGQTQDFIKGTDSYQTLVKHNKAPF